MPVAQITTRYKNDGTEKSRQLIYLHSDHLNTPRLATDPSQKTVWSWDSDAFGQGKPDTDPDQDGKKTFVPLRFPGQLASEGGVYYNYYRYYDPNTGRYITSDPIGLKGGLNTYGYVSGNPIRFTDPLGLAKRKNQKYRNEPCNESDLEECAIKCGGACNVERCNVRVTWRPKVYLIDGGGELGDEELEIQCECKGDNVDPLEPPEPDPFPENNPPTIPSWLPLIPFLTPWPDPY